jgi:hypothetical protein
VVLSAQQQQKPYEKWKLILKIFNWKKKPALDSIERELAVIENSIKRRSLFTQLLNTGF